MSAVLAVAAASLGGCGSLSADVRASGPVNAAVVLPGGATYAMAGLPLADGVAVEDRVGAGNARPPFDALLRDELAKRGFSEAAQKSAQYRLSIAYDTRPATIGVGTRDCARGDCEPAPAAPLTLFGSRAYRHSLTLRLFDSASGVERYKVSAVIVDRDADPLHAMPALVKSALAKFPFDPPPDWRVKLRSDKAGGAPEVMLVKPLQP